VLSVILNNPPMTVLCFNRFQQRSSCYATEYSKQTSLEEGFSTAFRRWTTTEEGDVQEGLVPGLRKLMTEAGLSCFCVSVEAWCRENGASCLSELVDEVDNICSVLGPPGSEGLAPELPKRLHKALSVEAASEESNESAIQHPIEYIALNTNSNCKHISLGDAELLVPSVTTRDRHQDAMLPGLKYAFHHASLSHLAVAAEVWSHANGAVFLHELLDNFDDLCDHLCLDPRFQGRLRQSLSSYAVFDSRIGNLVAAQSEKSEPRAKAW
jgi:hypothetical protein